MDSHVSPVVVFIARESTSPGSRIIAEEWLMSSLKHVAEEHEKYYNTIGWQAHILLPFVHSANEPWLPGARHIQFMMTDVVARAKIHPACEEYRQQNRHCFNVNFPAHLSVIDAARSQSLGSPVMPVVSGWSGITTCPLMWDKIFGWFVDADVPVQVRIYADNPRRFFDVNPDQVRGVLRGDITPGESTNLDHSTEIFIRNFKRLNAARVQISEASKVLWEIDGRRNCHTGWAKDFKYICGVCGEKFTRQNLLVVHQKRRHPEVSEDHEKASTKCAFCQKVLTRADSVVRHERACPMNPQAERKERKKNVRRGLRLNPNKLNAQPKGSDNALKSYLLLTEDDAPLLPRIDTETPIIFRGELHCRFPGCEVTTRYHKPGALRVHYKVIHSVEYQKFSTTVGEEGRLQHEACTSWLARSVQLGQENAGPVPPTPTFW